MTTINEQFSHNPKALDIGKITGSFTATQMGDFPCKLLRFKADPGNAGEFVIGDSAVSLFFPLEAGDDTGWIPANNMNEYWYGLTSGTTDFLYYWRLY
jgi:hypothetical protein